MKIYDISQEILSCRVYPGDPAPKKETLMRISEGSPCNLSAFSMCAHNGTHIDAPYHFIDGGKTIEKIPLDSVIGPAYVAEHTGTVNAEGAAEILQQAAAAGDGCDKRILIKGNAVVSEAAAQAFVQAGILLLGNESQTVGPEDAPMKVHRILLEKEVVILEGICLDEVPEGKYILYAAPLKLAGFDGAPCRAVLTTVPI
ncbi:MAG: cyclase family protein [Parasporobacterium sp.]|nr:cyclase family protein [Parasporobacterium sp.]